MPRPATYDRADVLDSAMRLFWRKGYEAISLQDILDETGFNRHSLYREFGDKDGLFHEALKLYKQNFEEHLAASLESETGGLEAIRNLFAGRRGPDVDGMGCLFTNSVNERNMLCPDVLVTLDRFASRFVEALQKAVEVAQRNGEISEEKDAASLAQYLITVLHGLGTRSKAGISETDARSIAEHTIHFLTQPTAVN